MANFHDVLEEEIMNHRRNFISERSHRKESEPGHDLPSFELKPLNATPEGFAQQNALTEHHTGVSVQKTDVCQGSSSVNIIDSV